MKNPLSKSILWKGIGAVVSSMMVLALLPMSSAAAAATNVTAGGEYSYTEQQGVIPIGDGITITNGTSYDGEYLDFEVTGADAHDLLSLSTDATASTAAGVVSIVGSAVYLGNGSIAEPVGSVDPTFDGQEGRKLRVNFTTEFANPGFEDGGTLGWTPLEQRIDLGSSSIAGFAVNDTSTYPGSAPNKDNNTPASASYSVGSVSTGDPTEGIYALQLQSNMTTAQGCDVVHGPAVYSSEFEAAANDKIYFDWRAFSGSDAYAVFGYIIDRDGHQTEVLDAYGNTSSNTNWATKETVIPTAGHYRFVFVAGTFDASCGKAAGASLLIDNVKVFGSKASDDVVQQVARRLQYSNTSDNPAAERTVTVTAKSKTNGTDSDTLTVNITGVDDPLDAIDPADMTFVNHSTENETFNPIGGQVAVVDPDTTSFNFELADATAVSATVGGKSYDQAVTTDYGTLYVDSATGRYVFDPDSSAIDARLVDDLDQFTVTVSAGEFSDEATLTMRVDIPEGVPGTPTNLHVTPGNGNVELTWEAPTWIGGQGVTGYRVEVSSDGASWSALSPDGESGDTTRLITGLDNGTDYRFRVSALNGSGASTATASVTSTPRTVPGAPTITGITEGDGSLTVAFSAPSSNGGAAVTSYKVSIDGGDTWSYAGNTAGSITLDDLTNGKAYDVIVVATNAAGTGSASSPLSGTPRTTPDAPTISEILKHDGSLEVGISAPDFDGGSAITGYEVSLDGGTSFLLSFGPDVEWATIDGLTNGTNYAIVVRAVNEAGAGSHSATATAVPRTIPGKPVVSSITEGNRSFTVTVDAPADDGGAAITGYEVSTDGGVTWAELGGEPGTYTVDSLANGTTYGVTVRARNEAGHSVATTSQEATPRTVPGTPRLNSVTETNGALVINFAKPDSDGGASISGYEVSLDGGATWQTIAGPGATRIDGLVNGQTYKVSIRAVNEAGAGISSAARPATPRTTASAPAITRITAANRSLRIFISAPSSNGGAAVTSYEASLDNGVTWTRSFAADKTFLDVYGLENGTTYPVRVRAVNAAGSGTASMSVPGTPIKAPIALGDEMEESGSRSSGSGSSGGGQPSSGVEVSPGKSLIVVNGEPSTVDTKPSSDGTSVGVSGEGWTAQVGGIDENGEPMSLDAQGRLVVTEGGSVRVSGSGFAPGSTVDVWLFSTPTYLGDVTVRSDGTFQQLFSLPEGIEIGEHTIQMNGLGTSGQVYSVSTGLILNPAPESAAPKESRLAFTGALSPVVLPFALVAMVAGVVLVLSRRRYQQVVPARDSATGYGD